MCKCTILSSDAYNLLETQHMQSHILPPQSCYIYWPNMMFVKMVFVSKASSKCVKFVQICCSATSLKAVRTSARAILLKIHFSKYALHTQGNVTH